VADWTGRWVGAWAGGWQGSEGAGGGGFANAGAALQGVGSLVAAAEILGGAAPIGGSWRWLPRAMRVQLVPRRSAFAFAALRGRAVLTGDIEAIDRRAEVRRRRQNMALLLAA